MPLFNSCQKRIRYQLFKRKSKLFKKSKSPRFKVLFFANGGIGDLLSSICFIEHFYTDLNSPQIDFLVHTQRKQVVLDLFGKEPPFFLNHLFSRKEVHWNLFSKYIKKEYDLFVELCGYMPLYYLYNRKKISKTCPRFLEKYDLYTLQTKHLLPAHNNRPYYDHHLAQIATFKNLNRKSFLGHLGQIPIPNEAYVPLSPEAENIEVIERLGLQERRYITLHSGSDTAYPMKGQLTTKQWPTQNYESLIRLIKAHYPFIKVVYLKGPNSPSVKGADLSLETSFSSLLWILKFSRCHIDCESGLVRIARELHTKSVVIFGPTNFDFFKFEENENLKPEVCGNCFWLAKDWQTHCMKGYKVPLCQSSISVEKVFKAFENLYSQHERSKLAWNSDFSPHSKTLVSFFKSPSIRVALFNLESQNILKALPRSSHVDIFLEKEPPHLSSSLIERVNLAPFSCKYGSIYNTPCSSSSYDLVVCKINIDEPYFEYAFIELLRILKAGGKLQVTLQAQSGLGAEKKELSKSLFIEKLNKLNLLMPEVPNQEEANFFFKKGVLYFEKLNLKKALLS